MLPTSAVLLQSANIELPAAQEAALSGGSDGSVPCMLSSGKSDALHDHDLCVSDLEFSGKESEATDSWFVSVSMSVSFEIREALYTEPSVSVLHFRLVRFVVQVAETELDAERSQLWKLSK
jgi:hypothetical protein